ncbi:hypothetical protein [Flyfo siphovirus Tbat1_6]|nr:hypothetical protein PRB80_gp27 [Flyfo siphovirus Tbat1_6]UIW10283.1 hypothetical protein [Flyfo siphovirus Tbat1_6]
MWLIYVNGSMKPVVSSDISFLGIGLPILIDGRLRLIQRIVRNDDKNRIV